MKQIRNVTKKLKDLLYICCCCYSRLSTSLRRRRDSPSDMGTGYHKGQLYLSIQQRAPRWEGYGAPWVEGSWSWRSGEEMRSGGQEGDTGNRCGCLREQSPPFRKSSLRMITPKQCTLFSASCDVDVLTVVLLFRDKKTEAVKHLVTCPNSDSY